PPVGESRTRRRHVGGVQFDKERSHIVRAGVAGERAVQVAPLACAQAHHADRSGGSAIHGASDQVLDNGQPAGNGRGGVLVLVVPGSPIHRSHPFIDVETATCSRSSTPDSYYSEGWS